jgi:hypothetical protein
VFLLAGVFARWCFLRKSCWYYYRTSQKYNVVKIDMKKIFFKLTIVAASLLLLLLFSGWEAAADSNINKSDCTYQGKKLYGKVQFVEELPDIKVKVVTVTSRPDLRVKLVPGTTPPVRCGEWQVVDLFPDLKVQFVESLQDIVIQFVASSPGIPVTR